MRIWSTIGFVAAALMVALPAVAFEEVTAGGSATGQSGAAAPPATGVPGASIDSMDLSSPETGGSSGGSGTEVKIPGLGSIGVLPKLDFGLELLYGATKDGAAVAPEVEAPADGDLTIKGEIKHTF